MTLNTESIYSLDPLRKKMMLSDQVNAGNNMQLTKAEKEKAHMHTRGTSTSTIDEMGNLPH